MSPSDPLAITEIKAFVPARDFALSKRFYRDIGFTMASEGGGVAYFHRGEASFLLMDFNPDGLARNMTMHVLVGDVDAWWAHLDQSGVRAAYGVALTPIILQPWRMRDFTLGDPSGVTWRIGQNVGGPGGA